MMKRPQNGTLKILGIACVLAGVVFAWGQSHATLQEHERRIIAIEVEVRKIGPMYWLVRQMASRDGIELPEE